MPFLPAAADAAGAAAADSGVGAEGVAALISAGCTGSLFAGALAFFFAA